LPVGNAAAVPGFNAKAVLGKGTRTLDRTSQLLLAAMHTDLAEMLKERDHEHTGLVLGTALAGVQPSCDFDNVRASEGPGAVNPAQFAGTVFNCAASQANIRFNIQGLTATLTHGAGVAVDACAYAAERLAPTSTGAALSMCLAGGADGLSLAVQQALSRFGLLVERDQSVPYSDTSRGLFAGEGAAMLALTAAGDPAREAAAEVRVLGSASRCLPTMRFDLKRQQRATAAAISAALDASQSNPDDIDAVISSANGVPDFDSAELAALSQVFAGHQRLRVSPLKVFVGECFAASGAMQLVAAVHVLQGGLRLPAMPWPALLRGKTDLSTTLDDTCRRLLVVCQGHEGRASASVLATRAGGHHR